MIGAKRGEDLQVICDSFGYFDPKQPQTQYQNPTKLEDGWTVSSAYSDRMIGWNHDKFNDSCQQVWGNHSQMFFPRERKPEEIERFLQLYFGKPKLILMIVSKHVNWATGFDLWQFTYAYPREGDDT